MSSEPTRSLYIAAVGDSSDIRTWSGTPYHFWQGALEAGIDAYPLPLDASRAPWPYRRLRWNILQVARMRGRGGYQYSSGFLEKLWQQAPELPRDSDVVNFFQLYPPSLLSRTDLRLSFYIDATLTQLFRDYRVDGDTGAWIRKDALARELEGYQRADRIFTMSSWARDSVINDYGIDSRRVKVILNGPCLVSEVLARGHAMVDSREKTPESRPLRALYIGKDWRRKGLLTLLQAMRILESRRAEITLEVVGCDPAEIPPELRNIDGVVWRGFIDKARSIDVFLDTLVRADVGILLPEAEASAIVFREWQAMGLAVIATDVGGVAGQMVPGAADLLPAHPSPAQVAERLLALLDDPARLRRMRAHALAARDQLNWKVAATTMMNALK